MKTLVVIAITLVLVIAVPLKGFCGGGELLIPNFFWGIISLASIGSKGHENVSVENKDLVTQAKNWAKRDMLIKKKKSINFSEKFNETVVNSESLIITFYGTKNGQQTLISLGFKKEKDKVLFRCLAWDDIEEYQREASTTENLVKMFKKFGLDLGPIESQPTTTDPVPLNNP